MSDGISTATRGAVFEVTIDRPKANAIDLAASRRLNQVFAAFRDDPALRVAIVTGAGERFFCPGWDLKGAAGGEESDEDWGPGGFGGLNHPRNLDKPLIAAVNGIACGGGFEIVLGTDIIVMEEHAKFALPEINVGVLADGPPLLFPAIKQLLRHTEMVPEHPAFELHDSLSAVQKVIRSEDLKEGARAFAEKRKPVWKGK